MRLSPFSGVSHKYPWGGSMLPEIINIKAHSQIGVNLGKSSYLLEKFYKSGGAGRDFSN